MTDECSAQKGSVVAVHAEKINAIMQVLECTDLPNVEPRPDDKIHP